MKLHATLLMMMATVASAASRTIHFKGLNIRYALIPQSLYYIRSAYSCHYGIPVDAVTIESISWYNTTSIIPAEFHINDYQPSRPLSCSEQTATQWSSPKIKNRALRQQLEDEEPISIKVRIDTPIGIVPAYNLNLLPYLSTAVDEYYGDLLGAPHLFVNVEAAPIGHLLQQLEDLDAWTLLSIVVGLHLIGASGLLLVASRSRKAEVGPRVADMV